MSTFSTAGATIDLVPPPELCDPYDMTKYSIIERIGEGTFSVVYRAKRNVTNATKSVCDLEGVDPGVVALKCIHPNSSPTRILNELQHLKILSGQNSVLPLLGGFRARCGFIVILPYFEHDDFKWYLPRLSTAMLQCYLKGLFLALAHVANHGIIHRDIKPRNYLFSMEKRQGLLIDFGLAQGPSEWQPIFEAKGIAWDGSKLVSSSRRSSTSRKSRSDKKRSTASSADHDAENVAPKLKRKRSMGRGITSSGAVDSGAASNSNKPPARVRAERAGTPGFRAPEVLFMSLEQTPAIDMWSAGVIMLSLLSSRYPIFPKPERGPISSDAQAIAQIEALLGRDALERAARACHKDLIETPGDRNPISPPSLKDLCEQGRKVFFDAILKKQPNHSPLDKFPDSVYDLLHRCLEVEPERRISAKDALSHSFFSV
eukprot:g8285.t1